MPREIAVIGSGNIGAALARAWNEAGHGVTFGARDAASAPQIPGVDVKSVADAIRGAAVVSPPVAGSDHDTSRSRSSATPIGECHHYVHDLGAGRVCATGFCHHPQIDRVRADSARSTTRRG